MDAWRCARHFAAEFAVFGRGGGAAGRGRHAPPRRRRRGRYRPVGGLAESDGSGDGGGEEGGYKYFLSVHVSVSCADLTVPASKDGVICAQRGHLRSLMVEAIKPHRDGFDGRDDQVGRRIGVRDAEAHEIRRQTGSGGATVAAAPPASAAAATAAAATTADLGERGTGEDFALGIFQGKNQADADAFADAGKGDVEELPFPDGHGVGVLRTDAALARTDIFGDADFQEMRVGIVRMPGVSLDRPLGLAFLDEAPAGGQIDAARMVRASWRHPHGPAGLSGGHKQGRREEAATASRPVWTAAIRIYRLLYRNAACLMGLWHVLTGPGLCQVFAV